MKTHRLLIVEDNEDTQELLCAQLEKPGFTIATVDNGQQAILSIGDEVPDLIIMDIMMPQLDGLETSRYFKLRFKDKPPPILVLSAKHDAESRQTAAEYGCEDYIDKPHAKQRLDEAVTGLLELSELEWSLAKADGPNDAEVDRIVDLRIALATRQLNEQSHGIALAHLERVLELRPDHEAAKAMHLRVQRLTAGES